MKQEVRLFHQKLFMFGISAVLLAIAALFFQVVAPARGETPPTPLEQRLRSTQIVTLHENFQRAMAAERISVEEWDKLDFTLPSDEGFGDNVEYEVFNPKSPRTVIVEGKPDFPLVPQDLMDEITTQAGQMLRFRLTSVNFYLQGSDPTDRMEVQALAAVILKANPDYCEEVRKFFYSSVSFGIIRDFQLGMQPDNLGGLPAFSWMFSGLYEGCTRPDQPSSYMFIPLAYRTRMIVGKQETAWHNIKARRLDDSLREQNVRDKFLP